MDLKKYPSVKILNQLPYKDSLYETALVTINDELVNLFLNGKIKYNHINQQMNKILNSYQIKKFKKKLPTDISKVINANKIIRSKINILK